MTSINPEIQFEAVRACGELELRDAVPQLAQLAHDPDRELQAMAIWSLGEIGGKQALQVLSTLAEEAEVEALIEVIEEAIGAASLVGKDIDIELHDE
jgi:HEAT repeat protein